MLPPQPPGFSSSQSYFEPQSASSDTLSYGPSTPFSAAPSESGHPTWGYQPQSTERNAQFPPPALPSIHSFGRNSTTSGINQNAADPWHPSSQGDLPYRAWNGTDSSYTGLEFGNSRPCLSCPLARVSRTHALIARVLQTAFLHLKFHLNMTIQYTITLANPTTQQRLNLHIIHPQVINPRPTVKCRPPLVV